MTLRGDTESQIVDAIVHSAVLILVFSSDTNGSKKVLRELALATSKDIPIVPLGIDNPEPIGPFKYYLGSFRWLDWSSPDRALNDLVNVITHLSATQPEAEGKLNRPPDQIAPASATQETHGPLSGKKGIVFSYRRSDSAAIAGRLFDRFSLRFGVGLVFMDIDSIPFGTNFRVHIDGALSGSRVLIALVGSRWLGKRMLFRSRIFDQDDPVRIELETAFQKKLSIIPVLIDRTLMPSSSELPASLKEFSDLNAAELSSGRDFDQQVERLIRSVELIVSKAQN
jgi:hypothetical protein